MKTITALFLSIGLMSSAHADGFRHHHGFHHGSSGAAGWIAPLVIGGAIGYIISGQTREPSPVYVEPTPVYTPRQPVYEERLQYDPNCNCYVKSYVQVGWR